MTADVFVESLKSPRAIKRALLDSLSQLLPQREMLASIELAHLEYHNSDWHGRTEFLLLLDSYVVHVKGILKDEERRTLSLSHNLFPLSALEEVTVTTAYEEKVQQVYIRSVKFSATFDGGGDIKAEAELPEGEVKKVLTFAQKLLATRKEVEMLRPSSWPS